MSEYYMNRKDIIDFLRCQDIYDIVKACNDIYEYRYITGILNENSVINTFAEKLDYWNIFDIADAIEDYSAEVFDRVVKLMMIQKSYMFIERR